MSLKKYYDKRNFKITPEPSDEKTPSHLFTKKLNKEEQQGYLYVIQKHAASHLHYDLRLEINQVLKSWAVPKRPHLNPNIKRLAIEVEDHPLAYGSFEGVIPEGQYGAGKVIIWDKGEWIPDADPVKSYQKGDISFTLKGKKLKGRWKLIKIKSDGGNHKKHWLFFKTNDLETSKTTTEVNKLDQIPKIEKKSLPTKFKPELCFLTETPPDGDNWLHEIKFDGYRIIAILNKQKVKILTRNGLNWTRKFPNIVKALQSLKIDNAIFDGELVALNSDRKSRFQLLQNALKDQATDSLRYYLFDLPYYANHDLSQVPLLERKKILKAILQPQIDLEGNKTLLYSEHIQGHGIQLYHKACKMKLEGIISKDANSSYENHRSHAWLKIKCTHRQEFVIGGYTKPKGSRKGFGSLLVGFYDKSKQLIYKGHVGTGFDNKMLNSLYEKLQRSQQDENPFYKLYDKSFSTNVTWVKPNLVIELEFTEWTEDDLLRHPAFLGLRLDKNAREVVGEKIVKNRKRGKIKKESDKNNKVYRLTEEEPPKKKKLITNMKITHPEKMVDDRLKITKLDLVEYYQQVAHWMLPHIINRPLSLLRCATGIKAKQKNHKACFFQKHYTNSFPADIYPIDIKEKSSKDKQKVNKYIFIKDIQGLLALIQMNTIEIHPWGSRKGKLEKPDRITLDLDPEPSVSWEKVAEGAFIIRNALMKHGLKSYVKTSGGKGLHLVIPILPENTWKKVITFAEGFSHYLAETYPDKFTIALNKSKRQGKIYIDYLRNGRGATTVAEYFTRAKEGLPISVPISWNELKKIQSAQQFTLSNMSERLRKLKKDPWEGFFDCQQSLPI